MFKVVIAGGENTNNYEKFKVKCISCLRNKAKSGDGIMIYSIGDKFVDQFAQRYGIDVRYFFTDWKKFGKDALKERNADMLSQCDAVITFNDGNKDTVAIAKMAEEKGLPLRVIK